MMKTRIVAKQDQDGAQDTEAQRDNLEIVTKATVAEMLSITIRTLEIWCKQGRLPYFKIGKAVRFRRAAIIEHLEANYRVN